MKKSIENVLNELEMQSSLEKSNIIAENRMLAITKETGEMLNMILRLNNVKNMLEIGTSTGYSTIWCVEAISDNLGEIITIEQNPNKIKRAKENFQKSELSDRISIKE
jgi:predicted O-methyltransferase YrrM